MNEDRPLLAITMGDPAGTGPEIIMKALSDKEVISNSRFVIVGSFVVMQAARRITGSPLKLHAIKTISEARFDTAATEVLDLGNVDINRLKLGQVDPMAGRAAYEYIETATRMALKNEVDALVTSAINKEALNKAGFHYPGHTEILAELCGVKNVVMLLVTGKLRVVHVTTHVSLRRATEMVTPERLMVLFKITDDALRQLGIQRKLIAVAGLNPHAGENGLFGDEEEKIIVPTIEAARRLGFNLAGPFPPDSVFFRAAGGEFDAVVAMYHDQGHIAVKMLGIDDGVNVTLGLPIIRTSVDHGTAFDKAGKGTASPRSLIESIKLANQMARVRKHKA
jgi:4-phospho-D-threonate 3-dehydrogenase / 4-phospho-D-erythronate 3-dehydrogenase